mgnify:CR=1 FL=1
MKSIKRINALNGATATRSDLVKIQKLANKEDQEYLSQKIQSYNGDVRLALASYNAGSGNVKKYAKIGADL